MFKILSQIETRSVEDLRQQRQHNQQASTMSHDPKSQANVNDATNFPDLKELEIFMDKFHCIKSICQDLSSLNQANLNEVPKLTKKLMFGNLKCYESIVSTVKCVAKYENDKVTILNNNIIAVERKLNANNSIPYVKYEFMLINDSDDDNECDNKSNSDSGHVDENEDELAACMFCSPIIIYDL